MELEIVRGYITQITPTENLIAALQKIYKSCEDNGTLYLGYPLSANSECKITVDALLVSEKKGVVAFLYPKSFMEGDVLREEQDTLYYQMDYNFKKYNSLRRGRGLAFEPKVITWLPASERIDSDPEYMFANECNLKSVLDEMDDLCYDIYPVLCEALQKVSNIKPRKKRKNVKEEKSKGGIIKAIEKEIANLDRWQKKAALEIPEGPQRIRGLAGSGKTIVLALKAAYLHSQYPEWKIAVTFYTRSLAQQYEELIRQFMFEFSSEEPNWNNLHIVHAWGTNTEPGIYSIAARQFNVTPYNFSAASARYGKNNAFEGICHELVNNFVNDTGKIYDAILIDEAQDLPTSFFKLCYLLIKPTKRIIWAYDELQNLNETIMPSVKDMFGVDQYGNLNISLDSNENEAKRDIMLPVCYRNPPWTLALAHSLGFGVYRSLNKVQMFDELSVWEDVGYKVESGNLEWGQRVKLVRKSEASPKYFSELLSPTESFVSKVFNTEAEQYKWIAEQIYTNIYEDELDPDDILVIFPDAYCSKRDYSNFRKFLMQHNIESILAGVSSGKDMFRIEGYVTCSGIYRAKGNEAPMVYIVNSQYCEEGTELIKIRNILFTAITRSRAWVRICGVGENMRLLEQEINNCIVDNNYALDFVLPTREELVRLRRIHRERTEEEVRRISKRKTEVNNIIEELEKGEIDIESVPELQQLLNLVKNNLECVQNERED